MISDNFQIGPDGAYEHMDNTIPKIKIGENGELQIDGNFTFEFSPLHIAEDLIPYKIISFKWNMEISQAEINMFGEDKIAEMFGERLKQDFIKSMKKSNDDNE